MLIGDRPEQNLLVVHQADLQWLPGQLEPDAAGCERPHTRVRLRDVATLCAAYNQSVVRACVGADAKTEGTGTVARDLEHIARSSGESSAGRRRAEPVRRVEPDVRGTVELHRARVPRPSLRTSAPAGPELPRASRRCPRIEAAARALPHRAAVARS